MKSQLETAELELFLRMNFTFQGDSGGPLVVRTFGGFTLAGIVSAGIGCGRPGLPGIYANVAALRSWVDDVLFDES